MPVPNSEKFVANTEPKPTPSFPPLAWAWLVLPVAFGGCAAFELTDEWYREAKRTTRLLAFDRQKSDADTGGADPWSDVGTEGRAGQPTIKENNDWWGKYIMSDKARQIERNLGVE